MKHFLLAMATLWCVASTFSSFAADNNKWKPLFGKNLENANYNPEVWSETDGVLGAVKDESIWTKDEYENFELDLDFKTDVGTNSGVVVYCTDTKDWIPNSVEIQIADDHCEKWGNGKPYEKCGAIYGHLGAVQDKVVKKPGGVESYAYQMRRTTYHGYPQRKESYRNGYEQMDFRHQEPGWKRYPKLVAQTFRRITDQRIYRITRKTWGFINLVP